MPNSQKGKFSFENSLKKAKSAQFGQMATLIDPLYVRFDLCSQNMKNIEDCILDHLYIKMIIFPKKLISWAVMII